jgi:hypothetical protein
VALALPLLAGFALAPLLGGRWGRLAELRLHLLWVFYAAIALQLVAFPFNALPWRTSQQTGIVLWLCSYALFLLCTVCNLRLPGLPLIAAGMLSNVTAVIANGGHMPALPAALRAAGLHYTISRNSKAAVSPHLAWLVDRWAAPSWVPWANVFSVGDLLIAAGGLILALGATGALRLQARSTRAQAPSLEAPAP